MTAATLQAARRNGNGPTRPVLRIAGLSKTFGATRALIDAALDIRPGEIHALVGQNGSGKSTLIKRLRAQRELAVQLAARRSMSHVPFGALPVSFTGFLKLLLLAAVLAASLP